MARFRIATLVLIVALSVTAALAVTAQRPEGRFDDLVKQRERGYISIAPIALERLDDDDDLRIGWEGFRARHEGVWTIYMDERTGMPALAYGPGIRAIGGNDLASITMESLEARIRMFLEENRTLFGDWTEFLTLNSDASLMMRKGYWKVVFNQQVDGLPVENARFEFHVNQGRLSMFGASMWSMPRTSGVPILDAGDARAVLDEYLGTSTAGFQQVGDSELTIVTLDADPALEGEDGWTGIRGQGLEHVLIWRLTFRVPGESALWTGEINAHDGSILAFYDGAHYESIRGGVFPISNDEDCADDGCEIHAFPMPFADFTESGEAEDFTDAFGNLVCVDPYATFETNLSGPYIHVDDTCGDTAESGLCETGVDLGSKYGENCDVAPGASPGNSAAARTAYYHLNRVAEAVRFYDPGNAWVRNPVTVKVNLGGTCNAFWNGDINMYGSGNGCANTGEMQGVTVHEWGHGYDENDGGGFDGPSEAYADIVAIFAARDSCMSRGWYTDGRTCSGYGDTCLTCTGIRDLDWAARQNNTPVTVPGFVMVNCPSGGFRSPCNMEDHCEGYLVGETLFDLATRDLPAAGLDPDSAWQLAERLWYESRPGSGGDMYACIHGHVNSCISTGLYQKLRVADDDDGDLSNGTPHAAAIFAAFDRHDFACGNASDAANQSTSGCPSLATPVLTVTEIVSGTELSWTAVSNADEYRIYRGDLGCDRQQVPIADLPATETTYLDTEADPGLTIYYRIEAFGSNHACHSAVSNCEPIPSGGRFQMNGYRLIEDGTDDNSIPDPGETLWLPVTLFNSGAGTGLSVNGYLQFVDPAQGVVSDSDATWADIAPSHEMESDDPHFEFTVDAGVSCGEVLTFELDILSANADTWTRTFEIPMGNPAPTEPVTGLLVNKVVNGEDLDLVLDWGVLVSAAGYHVLQSETPTFDSPVESGRTDGETTLTIPNGANTTPSLTYFQVRGVNSCDEEGP